jgi:23S rRNA (uracil1939-C5)-methyltransferase
MQETVRAERLVAGGDALARLADGRVVFVPGLIPGETALVRVVDERRDFARAVVERIDERSPDRVDPPCEALARGCGGCDWQHLSADAQRTWKTDIVRDALRRTARLPEAQVRWGGAVSPWAYRTTLRVAAGDDGVLGLRAEASNRVVPVSHCAVAVDALDPLLQSVRLRRGEVPHRGTRARGQRPRRDERDELTLRVSTSSGQATVGAPAEVLERVVGVPAAVAVGDGARLAQRVDATEMSVSAASFFQSGPQAAELLVTTVRSVLGASGLGSTRSGVLVDAYGGVGLFAATLGWSHTVVIETSRSACDDARQTLGSAATVVCSTFEAWDASTVPDEIAAVIADPARAGLGAGGIEAVARTGTHVVVLVSCDPVAMARDVAGLVAAGFVHREAVVLDLFPQTHHVEVVTLLER